MPNCRVVLISKSKLMIYSLIVLVVIAAFFVTTRQEQAPSITNNEGAVPVTIVQEKPAQPYSVHKVKKGETICSIAEKYELDVDTVQSANPDKSGLIYPGDEIVILPQKGVLHVVEPGDTLARLAQIYGVPVETIEASNQGLSTALKTGDKVFIPGARERAATVSRSTHGERFIWPCFGELTSPFGQRWGRAHEGIDIANNLGTPVMAAAGGKVSFAGWQGGYGNTVTIAHNQDCVTLYGHLAQFIVSKGESIQPGQIIGFVGNTGNSTGPHLHFEVRIQGRPINPIYMLP